MNPFGSRALRLTITSLFSLSLFSGGCTKTYHARVARYELGSEPLLDQAPRTGIYTVKWTRTPGKNLKRLEGTATLLRKGESLGFEPQDDGTVVAVAGQRRIVVNHLPEDARMLIWFHQETRQTQFGREVDKALDTAGEIAVVGAVTVGVGVGLGAAAYIDAKTDDDCFPRR